MPYVERDALGNIVGVFANLQPGYAEEILDDVDPAVVAFLAKLAPPTPEPSFLSRDFFTQLTVDDYAAITAAVAANASFGLLWDSLKAQGEAPVLISSPRFQQGWAAITQVLGAPRAGQIATALGITP